MTFGCVAGLFCYDKSAILRAAPLLSLVRLRRLNILAAYSDRLV
jgi:hypothetical protein